VSLGVGDAMNTPWDWRSRDPFGAEEPLIMVGGPAYFNHRFPGQMADAETGLYYNYYRDYDPQTGRYVQSDPMGLEAGINPYAYVGNNPLTFTDPFGLCACRLPGSGDLWKNYPNYNAYTGADAWRLIGGNLNKAYGEKSPGGTQNSCAARLSYALNRSGAPIPKGAPGANRNDDGQRYIISARELNSHLKNAFGPASETLSSPSALQDLRSRLADGQVAILSSQGHAAVVSRNYADPYASSYLGDVWILPKGSCSCN
jgi:RHS repeat-associated protein